MADRSASLEHLLVREIERRLELERYCSSLEAELFSLAAQLRHEKLNNITLRHMVPLPTFGYNPLAAEFYPDPSYTEVEELALTPEERGDPASSMPSLESAQEQQADLAGGNKQANREEGKQEMRAETETGEGA